MLRTFAPTAWLTITIAACADPPSSKAVDPPTDDSEPVDTEPVADDTETTDDTEDASDPDTLPPVDTGWDAPAAPSSWGAGFVDISGSLLDVDGFAVDPGSRQPFVEPDVVVGIFAELDGAPPREVVISAQRKRDPTARGELRIFRWTQGGLVRAPELEARVASARMPLRASYDMDADGREDLLANFTADAILYGGEGLTRFGVPTELADPWGGVSIPWDLDADGLLDLQLGYGSCDAVAAPMVNRGDRTFDLLVEEAARAYGFGVLTRALQPIPRPDGSLAWAVIGNACRADEPHPGFLVPQSPGAPPVAADLLPFNTLFKFEPRAPGAPFTQWEPMGAAIADLDADGIDDLQITLGFRLMTVFAGQPDGSFVDRTRRANLPFALRAFGTTDLPWTVQNPDLDQDGRPDMIVTLGDDEGSFHYLEGFTYGNMVWWNAGNFRFVDVSSAVGLNVQGSWKTLALDDPDEDGDADMILGGRGAQARVLRNDIVTGNHGFSLELRGTTSNVHGYGAVIEVEVAGLPAQRLRILEQGNCGGASTPMAFAGLGASTRADRVRVRWPSGYVQELTGLDAGQKHWIVEPPLLVVSPRTRSAPADGASRIELRLLDHDLTGAPVAATVPVVRLDGPGTIAAPTWDGDAWSVWVTAPAAPGEARVEATLGSLTLQVRPRLRWTAP